MLSVTQAKYLKLHLTQVKVFYNQFSEMIAVQNLGGLSYKWILLTLTFAVCKVPYTKNVIKILIVVLLNVCCFLRSVLKLHCDFLQVFVQLQNRKSMNL